MSRRIVMMMATYHTLQTALAHFEIRKYSSVSFLLDTDIGQGHGS